MTKNKKVSHEVQVVSGVFTSRLLQRDSDREKEKRKIRQEKLIIEESRGKEKGERVVVEHKRGKKKVEKDMRERGNEDRVDKEELQNGGQSIARHRRLMIVFHSFALLFCSSFVVFFLSLRF